MQDRAMKRIWLAFVLLVLSFGMSAGFWRLGRLLNQLPPQRFHEQEATNGHT